MAIMRAGAVIRVIREPPPGSGADFSFAYVKNVYRAIEERSRRSWWLGGSNASC